jgi:hypothetical protein
MVHLAGLTGLQRLDVRDTPVTGAGLAHLKGLTGLQELWLTAAQASDTGVAELTDTLLRLKIVK